MFLDVFCISSHKCNVRYCAKTCRSRNVTTPSSTPRASELSQDAARFLGLGSRFPCWWPEAIPGRRRPVIVGRVTNKTLGNKRSMIDGNKSQQVCNEGKGSGPWSVMWKRESNLNSYIKICNLKFSLSNGVPKEKAGVPSKTLRHLQQINTYRLIMLHMENDFWSFKTDWMTKSIKE